MGIGGGREEGSGGEWGEGRKRMKKPAKERNAGS